MLNSFWDGKFAIGLFLGIATTAIALLLAASVRENGNTGVFTSGSLRHAYQQCMGQRSSVGSEILPLGAEESTSRTANSEWCAVMAQLDTARSTSSMTIATWSMTALTLLGMVLLYRTWVETRRAADAAARSVGPASAAAEASHSGARAALEANDIARKNILDQNRPYVLIRPAQNNVERWYAGTDSWFLWPFVLENFGQSPAMIKSVEAACWFDTDFHPDAFDARLHEARIPAGAPMGEVETATIGPRERSRTFEIHGPNRRSSTGKFEGNGAFIFLRVRVSYNDVHGRDLATEALYRQQHHFFKAEEYGGQAYNHRT